MAGKEELNFEELQEGNNLLLKSVPDGFFNRQEEVFVQKSPKIIDCFIFNYLAVDNVGQTADNA